MQVAQTKTKDILTRKVNRLKAAFDNLGEDLEEVLEMIQPNGQTTSGGGRSGMDAINASAGDDEDDDDTDSDDEDDTTDDNDEAGDEEEPVAATAKNPDNNGQGRVKHPDTDRRLKANEGDKGKPQPQTRPRQPQTAGENA